MSATSISPSEIEVYKLRGFFKISDFKCEKGHFEKYLTETAYDDHKKNVGKVWLFVHNDKVMGYVTLAMSQLHKNEHGDLGDMTAHSYIPGLLLGQMARDQCYKGKGLGKIMMDWVMERAIELARVVGCRLIILQAEDDKITTYQSWGFILIPPTKTKKNMMFYDLDGYEEMPE